MSGTKTMTETRSKAKNNDINDHLKKKKTLKYNKEDFKHIIEFSELIRKSEVVTYIPCIEDSTGS